MSAQTHPIPRPLRTGAPAPAVKAGTEAAANGLPGFVRAEAGIPFDIAGRRIGRVVLPLWRRSLSLVEAMAGTSPALPPMTPDTEGYFLRALPEDLARPLMARADLVPLPRQRYERSFVDLAPGFDHWMAQLSGSTRQGLRRKQRKLAEHCGGRIDLRVYRTADELALFFPLARAISAASYQERLLDAGLPVDALPAMQALAARDAARGFLLWIAGQPAAYLYSPAEGETLLYAHLGYDERFADHSPGSVLQVEALRLLMEEGRFRWFDFGEGGGQHKRTFASGTIASLDLLLLRPAWRNRALLRALALFDGTVAVGAGAIRKLGLHGLRRLIRR